jgi:hypothetical protein
MFDELLGMHLGKKEIRDRLSEDIEKKLKANPVGFLMKVGFPLVPKEVLMRHTGDPTKALRLVLEHKENGKGERDDAQ